MTAAEKKKLLAEVSRRLEKMYPDAECALDYRGDGWRLLVMGRLSAQCTDKRVNEVARDLFDKYPTAEDMARADTTELETAVKSCGLYRMKAKNIKEASRQLVENFGGVVPRTMDELLTLDGVGRKIANLLLGDLYGLPCVVCDTHFIRIIGRLGIYPESEKDPVRIEKKVTPLMDITHGSDFCHRIVNFGREVCTARGEDCSVCPMSDICQRGKKRWAK